jgi:hypothetical protein
VLRKLDCAVQKRICAERGALGIGAHTWMWIWRGCVLTLRIWIKWFYKETKIIEKSAKRWWWKKNIKNIKELSRSSFIF